MVGERDIARLEIHEMERIAGTLGMSLKLSLEITRELLSVRTHAVPLDDPSLGPCAVSLAQLFLGKVKIGGAILLQQPRNRIGAFLAFNLAHTMQIEDVGR